MGREFLMICVGLVLSLHRGHALDSGVLSQTWGTKGLTLGLNQLAECETFKISAPSESDVPLGNLSYHILGVKPDGQTMVYPLGHDPSSLYWSGRRPSDIRLFLAFVDSFGATLAILPAAHNVTSSPPECQSIGISPRVRISSRLKISSPVSDHPKACHAWEVSVSGGKAPYMVSIVALESGTVYNYSLPSGEHTLSYTHSGNSTGPVIGTVSDADGIFNTTSIVDIIGPEETDTFDKPPGSFSPCRKAFTDSRSPFRLEPPPPRTLKYDRALHTDTEMHQTRSTEFIGTNYGTTIAFAVCISLGGFGMLAVIAFVFVIHRRRKRGLIGGQDALPRPFELRVPAPRMTNTSTIYHGPTSSPIFAMSPRDRSQTGGHDRLARDKSLQPSTASSYRVPSQPQAGPSRGTHTASRKLSYTSIHPSPDNSSGPSFCRSPLRSQAPIHPPTLRTVSPGQSMSSQSTLAPSSRPAGPSATRCACVEERRSAKRADLLARYASEQYRAAATSSRRRCLYYAYDRDADVLARRTNHLRHVLLRDANPDPEYHGSREVVFQHQDAGVMHELPPPYHKLLRSKVAV